MKGLWWRVGRSVLNYRDVQKRMVGHRPEQHDGARGIIKLSFIGERADGQFVSSRFEPGRALCLALAALPSLWAGGTGAPPGSFLPERFSGRHFLELMGDFAPNRSKKLVEFVFDG
jgi:hypothetical protein